ncbi:MAG: fibronectin type III domain-containing protein [Parcubacteria group bacterium]
MLIQKRLSAQRKILIAVLVVIMIGAGIFAWLQYSAPTSLPATNTFDTLSGLSVRSIPDVKTDILHDQRLLDTLPFGPGRFTEQPTITPHDNTTPVSPQKIRVHDPSIGGVLVIFWELPDDHGADGIRVYRSIVAQQGSSNLVAEIDPNESYYEDETAVNGTQYYYIVKTCKRSATQTGSVDAPFCGSQAHESKNITSYAGIATDSVAPDSPADITLENVGDGSSVVLKWENPQNDDFSHIAIYRSDVPGVRGTQVITNLKDVTEYTDKNLTADIAYYYVVVAVDTSGNESIGFLYLTSGNRNPFAPIAF